MGCLGCYAAYPAAAAPAVPKIFSTKPQPTLCWCAPMEKKCGKPIADLYCKQKYGATSKAVAVAKSSTPQPKCMSITVGLINKKSDVFAYIKCSAYPPY